ncbi:MAG: aspartate/glutamate racemase family protein, partial [Nevskia sp.]|nr:aspartate/glutamate racemase family protein [Nevskia sp.]
IAASIAPLARPGLVRFEVVALAEGPAAVASWRDWHSVAEPLARVVESTPADAYVIACVSDPAIDLLRGLTARPVFGALRGGIGAALARADRFGILAFVAASVARQRRVLQAMGVEARCVASLPLFLPMSVLTSAVGPRARLAEVGRELAAHGAECLILGCAGMAGHRAWLEETLGLPVIEPCQAAAALATAAVL